jgi:hypothetical protein
MFRVVRVQSGVLLGEFFLRFRAVRVQSDVLVLAMTFQVVYFTCFCFRICSMGRDGVRVSLTRMQDIINRVSLYSGIKRGYFGVLSSPTCLTKRKTKAVVELEHPENPDGNTICTPLVLPNRRFFTGTPGREATSEQGNDAADVPVFLGSCLPAGAGVFLRRQELTPMFFVRSGLSTRFLTHWAPRDNCSGLSDFSLCWCTLVTQDKTSLIIL